MSAGSQNRIASLSLDLAPPEGPIARKWSMFVMLGEPGWPRRHVEALAAGGVGTAKTSALVAWVMLRAWAYPGIRIALTRDSLENLKRSTLQTLFERSNGLIAEDATAYKEDAHIGFYSKREEKIYFQNGSTIWLFGLGDHRAVDRLVGTEWGGIAVDQLERVPKSVYEGLITRLRQKVHHKDTGDVVFPMIKATANLDFGRSSWVFKRFFEDSIPLGRGDFRDDIREKRVVSRIGDEEFEAWRAYFAFRMGENLSITPYYKQVLAAAGDGASGFIADEWESSLEEVFGLEWKSEYVYDDDIEARGKHLVVGLDFGIDSPTVAIFGLYDPESELVYLDNEYHAANMDAKMYATSIGVVLNDYARRGVGSIHIYADPSMWNRTGTSAQTAADIFISKVRSMLPQALFVTFQQAYRKGTISLSDPSTVAPLKEAIRLGKVRVHRKRARLTLEMVRNVTWRSIKRDIHPITDFFDAFRYLVSNIPSSGFLRQENEDENPTKKKRVLAWRY